MKEIYEKPDLEIIRFETEDVITTSDGVIHLPFEPAYYFYDN